ncbi:MAG: PolC-type DNA polymerase III [Clostridia bacterium]|nr:PolC-type DNA polymerase III [Clostridia bacterium]
MEKTVKLINASEIKNIVANKSSKSIKIDLVCKDYISLEDERKIKKYFKKKFNIADIDLNIEFFDINFSEEVKDDIRDRIIYDTPLMSPFKKDICIRNEKNECIIEFPNISEHLVKHNGTAKSIHEYIRRVDKNIEHVKVCFIESIDHQNSVTEIKNKINKDIKEHTTFVPKFKKEVEPVKNSHNKKSIKETVTNIIDINSDFKRVAVQGKIIKCEFKTIKEKYELVNFDVTDYTSSISCKTFINSKNRNEIMENIKKGNFVVVEGDYIFDSYEKQFLIDVKKIEAATEMQRLDESEKKRVELHLHTKMSSMDGFIVLEELFKTLKKWNHKFVAITDHGVLQAFPEVMELAAKYDITPIYGMEAYMIDDGTAYLFNPNDLPIMRKYAACYINDTEIEVLICEEGNALDRIKFNSAAKEDVLEYIDHLMVVYIEESSHSPIVEYLRKNKIEIIDVKKTAEKIYHMTLDEDSLKSEFNLTHMHDGATVFSLFEKMKKKWISEKITTTNKLAVSLVDESAYKENRRYHAVLLAKNEVGLKNMYELVSYSHLNFYYKRPIVPKSLLDAKREGLIIGSACEAGELYQAILSGKNEFECRSIAGFYDYLEIQPVGNNEFMVREELLKSTDEIKNFNRKVVETGELLDIPVVATCDAHFLEKRDFIFREIIMHGQKYKDAKSQPPLYLRTTEEMFEEFSYLDYQTCEKIIIENTNKIAQMITSLKPIPDGTFPPKIEGSDVLLREATISRAKEIYGEHLPGIVEERMNRELDSIISHGFSVMYIIAQKLVQKSLSDGYLVGSRGSVGSSFVAYLSGITEVNSLSAHYICPSCKHADFDVSKEIDCGVDLEDKNCPLCGTAYDKAGFDIPFETFLGFYGDKEPDIDLNFSGDYQSTAHKYVEELFGEDNVFRAGTISTIADKTAFGFVKNYVEESGKHASRAEIDRLIEGCGGVKKTTGQHPGGIMVMPKGYSIHEFTPIQRPADAVGSSIITTHFDFNSLHGRLLKLDILGHDDPTVLKLLHVLTGIDPTKINIVDEKILDLFISNKALNVKDKTTTELGVLGIPEFGTKFVREMLISTKPKTFSELVKISGLSHGTDVWTGNAEELINKKVATLHDVICTRDDIMLYLISKGIEDKAAFDIMEKVRKGKGISDEEETLMLAKQVPRWYVESCKKIKYMFPKSHAVAYVIMALRVAWYKIYQPLAYYAAFLAIRADEFDCEIMGKGIEHCKNYMKQLENTDKKLNAREKKIVIILETVIEMYARGYEFLHVDLYKSHSKNFLIEDGKLRMPLLSIAGLGVNAAENIILTRESGPFTSIDDLKLRAQLSKTQIEKLVTLDVLDSIPKSSQVSFF